MTTSIVLLGLVGVWGAYLVIWWRDNRSSFTRRTDMIGTFNKSLDSLASTAGVADGGFRSSINLRPRSVSEAAQRRRMILVCLGGVAILTLLLAMIIGTVGYLTNVMVDATLVWYAHAVIQRRNFEAEREMKVTMLHVGVAEPNNVIDFRATVNA